MVTKFPEHLDRRPAVVTGASVGIGAATARTLAAQGFPVALGARRGDKCEEVAAQIRDAGGEAFAHQLDVTDTASVSAFHKAVTETLGPVEIVVSNAGGMRPPHPKGARGASPSRTSTASPHARSCVPLRR